MSEPNEPLEENAVFTVPPGTCAQKCDDQIYVFVLKGNSVYNFRADGIFVLLSHLSGQTIQSYAGETVTFLLFSWPECLVRFN